MNKRTHALSILVLAVSMMTLSVKQTMAQTATTLIVDDDRVDCPKADYVSIQQAVIAANADPKVKTIKVCPGTYNETVNVNKPLNILGALNGNVAKDRTIDPTRESIVNGSFNLSSNEITVDGFIIQNSPTDGITTNQGFSGYVVRNNIIQNNSRYGLYFHSDGVKLSVVERNLFVRNTEANILSELGLVRARIEENKLIGTNVFDLGISITGGFGPSIPQQSNIIIRKNELLTHSNHVQVFFTSDSEVSDNVAAGSAGSGFVIGDGSNNVAVMGNNISEGGSSGIVLQQGGDGPLNLVTNNLIKGNTLINNGRNGIYLLFASGNTIRENRCEHNGYVNRLDPQAGHGIHIRLFSNENVVRENKVLNNFLDGIRVQDGSEGNALSQNLGTNNQEDGIGIRGAGAPSVNNILEQNTLLDNGEHDAHDNFRASNTWNNTNCRTDSPPGTICQQTSNNAIQATSMSLVAAEESGSSVQVKPLTKGISFQ